MNGLQPGGTATEYDIVNEAYRPRFARYDLVTNHEKRLGLTNSIQWQPDDDTLLTIDSLYASYMMVRQEEYLEANSLGGNNFRTSPLGGTGTPISLGSGNIAVTNYTLDSTHNNLTALTANGVGLRAEHFITDIGSRFAQTTADFSHSFSKDFKVHGLVGWSESHMKEPVETTLTYDYNGGQSGDETFSAPTATAINISAIPDAGAEVRQRRGLQRQCHQPHQLVHLPDARARGGQLQFLPHRQRRCGISPLQLAQSVGRYRLQELRLSHRIAAALERDDRQPGFQYPGRYPGRGPQPIIPSW